MPGNGKKEKNKGLTWKDFLPIILALPMAVLVKIFIFTTYHVPTASMVPTIIPGDHILVEKCVFGPRIYINDKIYRFPGWRSIHRGDILVFNVPKEDSIFQKNRDVNYYNWKHSQASSSSSVNEKDSFLYMPIPGRTPFVKRVIGLPGDKIKYSNHSLTINGESVPSHPQSYEHFEIVFNESYKYDQYKDSLYRIGEHIQMNRADRTISGIFNTDQLSFIPTGIARITSRIYFPAPDFIPEDFTWARSLAQANHSIRIPYAGWTTTVDSIFLQRYSQILFRFEGIKNRITDHKLIDSDGNIINKYTFKQNYYWAMGDNRPYSVDSRAWGLIPEDHIIGITRRTFWSKVPEKGFREGFRWNRFWDKFAHIQNRFYN